MDMLFTELTLLSSQQKGVIKLMNVSSRLSVSYDLAELRTEML